MTKKRIRAGKPAGEPLETVWTNRALADLEAIGDYHARDNPVAAARWLDELIALVEKAAALPLIGRRVPEIGRDEIREVLKRAYRIVYRVGPERIEVLTVFEGHRLLQLEFSDDDE